MTMPCRPLPDAAPRRALPRGVAAAGLLAAALALLPGCAVGVGVGIPIAPGLALGLGVGPGGPSVSLNTGWGPLGAGVALDGGGRVIGSAGVGASAGPVGVGIGQSVVLHDPQAPVAEPAVVVPGPYAPRPLEAP